MCVCVCVYLFKCCVRVCLCTRVCARARVFNIMWSSWCNVTVVGKWTWRQEIKTLIRLFSCHIQLLNIGKV